MALDGTFQSDIKCVERDPIAYVTNARLSSLMGIEEILVKDRYAANIERTPMLQGLAKRLWPGCVNTAGKLRQKW